MNIPHWMPARLSVADQPVYALAGLDGLEPQQFGDWIQRAKCAAACVRKSGYAACLARCLVTGQACDGGLDNCESA
jgi:hypothetical protein